MIASRAFHKPRQGFTLLEVLVVTVIIGILASLIAAAVIRARRAALEARIHVEIAQFEAALEQYRAECGDYPPSLQARRAVLGHVRKRFPRYALRGNLDDQWNRLRSDLRDAYGIDVEELGPQAALVFWLGGLPETRGTGDWKPAGFHVDPEQPFKPGLPRTEPYFHFDPQRVRPADEDDNGYVVLWYYPPSVPQAPYVYFRPRRCPFTSRMEYGMVHIPPTPIYHPHFRSDWVSFGGYFESGRYIQANVAVPYLDSNPDAQPLPPYGNEAQPDPQPPRLWRCPDTYQIICAGLDGRFGADGDQDDPKVLFRYTRTGAHFSPADYDNITNFIETGTLEDEL